MNIPIKLIKMSQTFVENKIDAEGDKNECCICYNDDSEEGNEGKLIECCPNKHILCVGCFHKSYERKCECPLCRELMYRPEIMTDVESFAYFGAKVALNDRRAREEQQRQFRLAEAERQRQAEERRRAEERAFFERQRQEVERRRAEEIARLPIRKTERKQIIQRRNDELMRQIATNNTEMENIDNLGLDEYNALYPEPRTTPLNIISDSDTDTDDDSVELVYGPQPRPAVRPVPVQNPVARPVVQEPRPLTMNERERIEQIQQLIGRPVSLQIHSVARPVQQPVQQQPVPRPVQQPVPRPQRPVQERRSSTYAYEKLVHNEVLVQTLRGQGMEVRYDRLNDSFIRVSDNSVYPTLNRASAAHALEVGLATTPNAWTTFKRLNGSSIDNL